MKKITPKIILKKRQTGKMNASLLFTLFASMLASAQVTLIDPAGDGGFETGATFAANGWTAVNAANGNRSWYIGAAQAGYTGARAAFIGNSNTNVGTATGAKTVHLYRSITIPAGAEDIQLTFKYKQAVADYADPDFYDYIAVYLSNALPTNGDLPAGAPVFGPFPEVNVPTFAEQTVPLPASVAGTTTNLIFTFKADGATPHAYGAVDDISLTYTMPSCAAPLGLAVTANAADATLTWYAPPSVPSSGYQFAVTSTNVAPASGQGTNALTGTVGMLTANSHYFGWVRSDCSGTFSTWRMIEFDTPCTAMAIPYNEDFESAVAPALPTCTALQNAGLGNNWETDVPNDGGFTTSALVYIYDEDEPANAWFYTRGLTLTGGTSYRITYNYGVGNATYPEKMRVAYGLQPIASAMASQLADHTNMVNATSPTMMTVDFTPATTGVYYIGFNAYSDADMFAIYVDDISVALSPSCLAPTNVYVNASAGAATINWTAASGSPAGYDFAVTPTSTPPATTDNSTGTSGTVNTLSADTSYFAWVRSNCGGGDTSEWIMIEFSTPCTPVDIPYVEDFESVTVPDLPQCTLNLNLGLGSDWVTDFPGDYGFDSNALMYGYDADDAADAWFFTRGINLTAGTSYRISYNYGTAGFEEKMSVHYGLFPNLASMTTQLADHPSITDDSQAATNEIDFIPATTGVYYFGFHAYSDADMFQLFVDDILVDVSPSCIAPTNVVVNPSANGAAITWTAAVGSSAGYDYAVTPTDTPPATGADATVTNGSVSSLAPQTEYYAWVRSDCGSGDVSEWVMIQFMTPCNAVDIPYLEDFNAVNAPDLPNCTRLQNAGSGNDWTTEFPDDYGFDTNALAYEYDSDEPADAWFFTRGVNLTAGTAYILSYNYGTAGLEEKMNVYYGTSSSIAGMATQLADHPNITNDIAPINNVVTFTPTVSGVYYFGFHAYSDADMFYLFVDDILVDAAANTGNVDMAGFSFHPNPVKDRLNLKNTSNISTVTIYDILGQKVMEKDINAMEASLDMQTLAEGAYIVNVKAGESFKTIKIIKKR